MPLRLVVRWAVKSFHLWLKPNRVSSTAVQIMAELPADGTSQVVQKQRRQKTGLCALCASGSSQDPGWLARACLVIAVGCLQWGNGRSLSWDLSYWPSKK